MPKRDRHRPTSEARPRNARHFFTFSSALTQYVSHRVHQVSLAPCLALYHRPLRQDEAGHHRLLLAQEEVEHLHAGGDALRQRAADHRVVSAHGFQHHAHIPDGAPLDGQSRQAVVTALLTHALHGRVGVSVVALAGVAAATAYRGEGHEVAEIWTRGSRHSGEEMNARQQERSNSLTRVKTRVKKCVLLVQVHGALIFRLIDVEEMLRRQILQHAISQHLIMTLQILVSRICNNCHEYQQISRNPR